MHFLGEVISYSARTEGVESKISIRIEQKSDKHAIL